MMDNIIAIETAISRFYASGDNGVHSWLLQIQASKEAWNFVWQLLDPSKPAEVQFFGATTLHEKILKQWNEIPPTEYLSLRERIIQVLKCPATSKVVLTRVCQSFAAFMVEYALSQEEQNKIMVEEIMEILPYNSPNTVDLLLKILETLPREFDRRKASAKHEKLANSLLRNWEKTSWLLQQIFSSCNEPVGTSTTTLYYSALECTVSWLRIGVLPLDTINPLYPHILVAASIYIPQRDDMGGECTRAWEVAQECLTMVVTHCELYKRPQLMWRWAESLICMVRHHGSKYFYEVLSAFGEAHSRTLLLSLVSDETREVKWITENLVQFLLECSELEGRYPTEERRSHIPFGFWYAFQDDIYTLDPPFDRMADKALKPVYARLCETLFKKSKLPTTPSEAGSLDEREHFRCYRQDIADTLTFCSNVLGEDLLIMIGQRLSQLSNDTNQWTEVEALIHAFRAVCDNLVAESKYVPAIFNIILTQISYNIYPKDVLDSVCLTIGDYAEWIGEHPDPWLEKSLQIVIMGLTQSPETVPAASIALKDLSRECKDHIKPVAPLILKTICHTLPNLTPGGGEALRLMFAAGKIINSLNSLEEQIAYLESTLGLCIVRLRELFQQPVNEIQNNVANHIKMVSMFLTTLEPVGSVGKTVLDALLPVFEGIVSHGEWNTHDPTLEAMHTCTQKLLTSLHDPVDAKPLLPILITSYKIHPHPAALYFLKQLVLLFGRDPDNTVGPIFSEISEITLRGVINCRQMKGNLSEISDLLQAYLELLAQICKKNTRLILQVPDQVPEMFQCGIACLLLPETGTVRAAGSFFTHAISQSPHLQTFIQPIGQELVSAIVRYMSICLSSNNLEPHAEVLLALNKSCSAWTAQWLRFALNLYISENVPQSAKEEFLQRILRERTNKRRLFEKMKEFNLAIAPLQSKV